MKLSFHGTIQRGHMQQYEEGGVTKYGINYRLQLEKRTLD
jgi:hypothetical protein